MGAEAEIRSYGSDDEQEVIALWQEVFPDEPSWNRPEDVILRKLSVQADLFYVANLDNRVVGTIIAGYDGVRGWIHKLAVHPAYRRKGLASELLRQAETGLRALGCPKLNLQVRASNVDAVQFYKSLGYHVEARASLGKPLI